MKISIKNLDQDEARTLVAQLGLHAANCRAILANKLANKGEVVLAPTLSRDDDIGNLDMLVAHITELENRLGPSAPTFPTARSSVYPGPTAGRFSAAPSDISPTKKRQTLTEKVLAAKGASSLSELAVRHSVNPADKNE